MKNLLIAALRCHTEVQNIQDIFAADNRRAGQAAGNNLAQDRQVRCHPKSFLGTAGRAAKAADHFIEDQHRTVLTGKTSQSLDEFLRRRHLPPGRAGGFQNNGGNVGVGGEDRHEIEICGVDPRTRGRRTDECLLALRGLLSGEPISHAGDFFSFDAARILPAPDPPVPIVVGGRSSAAVRRAGQHGDGWLGVWCSPRRFEQVVGEVSAHAAKADRPPPERHGLQVWLSVDADRARARARLARGMENMYQVPFERFEKYSPYGEPAEIADFLAPYVEAGCRFFNLMPLAGSTSAGIDAVAEIRERLQA